MFKLAVTRRVSQFALFGLVILVLAASATDLFKPHKSPPVAAPHIAGSPQSWAKVGQWYSFTPSSSAPSGYKLTFAISEKPAWASFNTRTGQLAGTPTSANLGTRSNIVISVSDGPGSAALRPFAITVSSSSSAAPAISGQPVTAINVLSAYSFTPTVAGAQGARLTFTIQNAPRWAAFNAATGQLSGTPSAADVGSYANIVIAVSNGAASAALAPFSIAVNQTSGGSATLNWMPPTRNTNGSALTNLAGYRVYYGTDASNLTQTINVASIGITSYTIGNLSPATWYFRMTSYTSSGVESTLTNLVSKTIP